VTHSSRRAVSCWRLDVAIRDPGHPLNWRRHCLQWIFAGAQVFCCDARNRPVAGPGDCCLVADAPEHVQFVEKANALPLVQALADQSQGVGEADSDRHTPGAAVVLVIASTGESMKEGRDGPHSDRDECLAGPTPPGVTASVDDVDQQVDDQADYYRTLDTGQVGQELAAGLFVGAGQLPDQRRQPLFRLRELGRLRLPPSWADDPTLLWVYLG